MNFPQRIPPSAVHNIQPQWEYCIHIALYSFMKLTWFSVDAPCLTPRFQKNLHVSISDPHGAAPIEIDCIQVEQGVGM